MTFDKSIAHFEQLIAEMTDQLVEQKLSWGTCCASAEAGLELLDRSAETDENFDERLFVELQEKFSGILKFKPLEEVSSDAEDMQYRRYYMIMALDGLKKLVLYLKEKK